MAPRNRSTLQFTAWSGRSVGPSPRTTSTWSLDASAALMVTCLLAVSMKSANGELSRECRHHNENYVWNRVMGFISLGNSVSEGTLVLSTSNTGTHQSCVVDLESDKLIVHMASVNSKELVHCYKLNQTLTEKNLLTNEKVQKLRFLIGFGNRIWYANDSGNTRYDLSESYQLNPKFLMSDIESWVKRYISSVSIEAVALVQTTDSSPSYPSAILALSDPVQVRVLKFQPVNALKLPDTADPIDPASDEYFYQPGFFPHPIDDMYLPNSYKKDKMTVIVFFDSYYGRLTIDTTREWAREHKQTKLEAFPILPAQGLLGCPIHLCWWPVIEDVMYYNDVYYFFQGRWLFYFPESSSQATDYLAPGNVIDLLMECGITFRIYAAYYDLNLNQVMIIKKNQNLGTHTLDKLNIKTEKGKIKVEYKKLDIKLEAPRISTVLSAVMIKGDKRLWVAFTSKGKTALKSFLLQDDGGNQIYRWSQERGEFAFQGLSGFFYNAKYNHLFIVTGYFLYIFEMPDFYKIEMSNCTVVEFNYFFNCTGYFDMDKMDIKRRVFTTEKQYSEDAQRFHRGSEFLPYQCNFKKKISFNKIPFEPKINTTSTLGPFLTIGLWMALSVTGAIVIGAALSGLAFWVFTSGKKKKGRRTSERRHSQERKLKQYLKNMGKAPTSQIDQTITFSTKSSSLKVLSTVKMSPSGQTGKSLVRSKRIRAQLSKGMRKGSRDYGNASGKGKSQRSAASGLHSRSHKTLLPFKFKRFFKSDQPSLGAVSKTEQKR